MRSLIFCRSNFPVSVCCLHQPLIKSASIDIEEIFIFGISKLDDNPAVFC